MISRIHKALQEREEGFTLIELLVVVIIIGILAAIAIPVFLAQRNKAHNAAAESDLKALATAEEAYLTDHPGGYTRDVGSLEATSASSGYGLKITAGDQLWVQPDNANGYCAISHSTQANTYFWYDSEAGGLNNSPSTTNPFNPGVACKNVATAPTTGYTP